jgi:hypothetical protein
VSDGFNVTRSINDSKKFADSVLVLAAGCDGFG